MTLSTTGPPPGGTKPPSRPSSPHLPSSSSSSTRGKAPSDATPSILRSPVKAIQVSKVAVRQVFYEDPTDPVVTKEFRHLIAAILTLNKKHGYHLQLCPVKSDGAHLDDVEDLAYSVESLKVFIGNFRRTNFNTSSGTIHECHGLLHLQHDVPINVIRTRLKKFLGQHSMFLNLITHSPTLEPVGWVQNVNTITCNVTQLAKAVTHECIHLYNTQSQVVCPSLRSKYGASISEEVFSLAANVTHISGVVKGNVVQLATEKETTDLAAALIDSGPFSVKIIPSYFDGPTLTKAMETHIKAVKADRFVFLDNWDESMTPRDIPNYSNKSLYHLLASKTHNGDRLFPSWNQSQLKSVAINVHPAHVVKAASLLQELVTAKRKVFTKEPVPRLRLRNLRLPAPSSPPRLANRWQPPSYPTPSSKSWSQVAAPSQRPTPASTITVASTAASTTSDTTLTQVTADMKEIMTEQMSLMLAQLLPGITAMQSSIQTVSNNVVDLSTKVSTLGEKVEQQQQETDQIKATVGQVETEMQALSQRVQHLESRAVQTQSSSAEIVPFLQQQQSNQMKAMTESFRSVFKEFHTPKEPSKRERAASTESRLEEEVRKRRTNVESNPSTMDPIGTPEHASPRNDKDPLSTPARSTDSPSHSSLSPPEEWDEEPESARALRVALKLAHLNDDATVEDLPVTQATPKDKHPICSSTAEGSPPQEDDFNTFSNLEAYVEEASKVADTATSPTFYNRMITFNSPSRPSQPPTSSPGIASPIAGRTRVQKSLKSLPAEPKEPSGRGNQ